MKGFIRQRVLKEGANAKRFINIEMRIPVHQLVLLIDLLLVKLPYNFEWLWNFGMTREFFQ